MGKIKWAIERVRNGVDERASYDIEYALLEYLKKALKIFLEKAPEVVEDEWVYYKGIKYSKYELACEFYEKIEAFIEEYWYFEDTKDHEWRQEELAKIWEVLRDYLAW